MNDATDIPGPEVCIDPERYRVLLEDVADGYYETDLKGNFTFFNGSLCQIFGREPGEIRGQNYRSFMDAANADYALQQLNRVYRTEQGLTDIAWEIVRKDGEVRFLEISANLIYDAAGNKAGFRGISRDVTDKRRIERNNETLFRIAQALPRYRSLDPLLGYITREMREILDAGGASVILLDEAAGEFYFQVAVYDDTEAGRRIKEIRFPADRGIAGQVYRTREPVIVQNTATDPNFFVEVDRQSGYPTHNMLDVPLIASAEPERMIGVLCAVNKKNGVFDDTDVKMLSTIAATVALPIENARITDALKQSYEEVKALNRAKERVIHHLSHELKTPVSVLSASFGLLKKRLPDADERSRRIIERVGRSLDRLLTMQYEIEDILREKDFRTHAMLSTLIDACADALETFAEMDADRPDMAERLRTCINERFGPREATPKRLRLERFVEDRMRELRPKFAHRGCRVMLRTSPASPVFIPPEVLEKIIDGLVRNAVENTPDGGRVEVTVQEGKNGAKLMVEDNGIGISEEDQRLVFESNFTTRETDQYASRNPYDFKAGGRGFDLLRMKIFSERYGFSIGLTSRRRAPASTDAGPRPDEPGIRRDGEAPDDGGGGTSVIVQFLNQDKQDETG